MILVDAAVLLLLIGGAAAVVALVLRSGRDDGSRRRAALERARWQAESRLVDDRTIVLVAKRIPAGSGEESLGEMVVAEVAATDPEWDIKVSQAMVDARVRADILNQENAARG